MIYKKLLFLALLSLILPATASAYSFEVDGIYYDVSGSNATVTYQTTSYNSYSGSVTIPATVTYEGATYNVTSIGQYAFASSTSLTSVTISESVTAIGVYAFQGCTELTSITIPESVTSIGNNAFKSCTALETINFNAVNCADFGSFSPFKNLNISTINFGSSVNKIPGNLAYGLTKLTSITIPESVTSIGNYAFYGCTGLTSVTIPESVTSIGSSAFQKCTALDTLNFNAVNCADFSSTASYRPFYNLNIATINFGSSVKKIPAYFAYSLTKLANITIPESVTTIGNYAFQGCTALDTLNFNAVNCADFSSTANYRPFYNLNISTINIGNSVQRIPAYFVCGLTNLANVTIGDTVTSIGNYAFQGCTSLTSVAIPNSVTSIGDYAFNGCTALESIVIPESIINIGDYAFDGTAWLDNQTGVVYIGTLAYTYRGTGSTVIIREGTTRIGDKAFQNCTSLVSVTIPNTVTTIGNYAFQGCTSLTSVIIPNSVTNVGEMAFSGCNLDAITIGENITSVQEWDWHEYWLRGMTPLSIHLSSLFDGCNVTSLTWNAIDCGTPEFDWDAIYAMYGDLIDPYFGYDPLFNGDNLENVSIGEQVTKIPACFAYNSQITEIRIPHSVTSIGNNAFGDCAHLKTIDWQAENCWDDGTYFGWVGSYSPFANDNVSCINIGSGVKTIGSIIFYDCHVDTIVCNAILPPEIDEYDTFNYSSYTDAVLCVPAGSLDDYMNAPGWKEFLNITIIGGSNDIIPGDVDGDGRVNINDVTELINMLLSGSIGNNADVDGDGSVNISDVTALINKLLSGN